MAVTDASKEAIYLRNFLTELGFPELIRFTVICDNLGALGCDDSLIILFFMLGANV